MAPSRLFVSHSHTDDQFTQQLVRDLKRTGAQVWVDQQGIRDGSIMDRINDALSHADWLILVQTPDAVRSPFVTAEVGAALTRVMRGFMQGVIPIIATPCDPRDVPPLWQTLRYYDATQDYPGALNQLLQALGLDKTPPVTAAPASGARWSPVDLMRLWAWIAPGARRAVGEIACRPEGYPYPEVLQRLGYDGQTLGGYLTSWAFGLRQFRGKSDPLVRDTSQYRMDTAIATTIRQLAQITAGQ
jgi:TIR domain